MEIAIKNLKRLLKKRGYTIGDDHKDEDEFFFEFTTDTGREGKAVFSTEENEGKKYVVDIFEELLTEPKHLIFVYNNITNYSLRMFKDYFKQYFTAELICINFLKKYLFDHPLVPDYIILSEAEKENVVKAYGGDQMNLPYIYDTDPVGIALNLHPGQVVKEISYYDHSLKKINKDRPAIITYRITVS